MRKMITSMMILAVTVFAQSSFEGAWQGAIKIQSVELGMLVNIQKSGDKFTGTIDIPQQNAKGLALQNISFKDNKAYFELNAGLTTAVFGDAELAGDSIKGPFKQGPARGTFYLVRVKEEAPTPPPYGEEEVSIKVNDQVTLAGTLTLPPDTLKHPAVVLITGSGAQDRNEEVFGFKIFQIIADSLTRHGIVVLRCDDRGFAKSTGSLDSVTTSDFAEDARAQVAYLMARPEVDAKKVGILGHSEGGLIAAMVAKENPAISFVILMAGPAVPGEDILLAQQALILKSQGVPEEKIEQAAELQKRIYTALRSPQGIDEKLEAEIRKELIAEIKAMPPKERKQFGNANKFVDKQMDAQIKVLESPWFRFFLDYDPRQDLSKISARTLAFYGKYDLQVPAEMDSAALAETFNAAGKTNYTIKVCCQANHLFQSAITGAISEYSTLPKEFTPCFLPAVINWVNGKPIPEGCEHEKPSSPSTPSSGCKENPSSTGCGGCPFEKEHNK